MGKGIMGAVLAAAGVLAMGAVAPASPPPVVAVVQIHARVAPFASLVVPGSPIDLEFRLGEAGTGPGRWVYRAEVTGVSGALYTNTFVRVNLESSPDEGLKRATRRSYRWAGQEWDVTNLEPWSSPTLGPGGYERTDTLVAELVVNDLADVPAAAYTDTITITVAAAGE